MPRVAADALALLRSLAFMLVFYAGSVPIVLLAALALPVSMPLTRWLSRLWALHHLACAWLLLGIRVRIEGDLNQGPVLYAFKHESFFETIELLRLFDQAAVVAKQELASIPVWSLIAGRYGLIFIDRAGGAAALRRMLAAVRGYVAANRPIVIFPEGTSVPPGERPPLQSGFAGLYKLAGLPVVPVAVASGRCFPRHGLIKRPGTIVYRVGDTIPPGLDRATVEARVHAAINALNPVG